MTNQLLRWLGLGKRVPTPPLETTSADQATILEVTDTTFDQLLATPSLVVVDFWAEWCQPCQIISAYVTFLAKDFGEQLVLAALDVDENPAIAERYDILGLPTLLLLRHGEVVDRIVGVEPYATIRNRVAQQL